MGMYTGVWAKFTVKPEYRESIADVLSRKEYNCWATQPFGFMQEFSKDDRCSFIPFGAMCYVPDEASNGEIYPDEYNKTTGVWSFSCSLKNYDNTIEKFINLVLSEIAQDIEFFETCYECGAPIRYTLVNGVLVNKEYEEDDE